MTILELHLGRGAKSLIQCNGCNIETEELTSRIHKSILHFCNMRCKALYYSKKETPFQTDYHKQKQLEHRDAKLKRQDEVKKRCMRCNITYYGPPGNFPETRDPNNPEPGVCSVCADTTMYDESDWGAGLVEGI